MKYVSVQCNDSTVDGDYVHVNCGEHGPIFVKYLNEEMNVL